MVNINSLETQSLVSIGVPSYNNGKFIRQTLDSIHSQTYKHIELIINDDCSTDNSVAIIEEWIKEHAGLNVVFIRNEINKGLCKSLNNILAVYKGAYLSVIASDDKYLPDFVMNRVKHLQTTSDKVGICYSKSFLIDEHESKRIGVEERSFWPSGFLFEKICGLDGSFCKPFTSMVKRSVYDVVGKYDDSLLFEDIDFFLKASRIFQINFLDVLDTEYRVVKGSLGTQVYSIKGLVSLSKIIARNFGVSKETDLLLAKRLRKVALKKMELGEKTWIADLQLANSYNKKISDTILASLGKIGIGNSILKNFRK
ncbi:MAG: glycosyltransferase [Ferruginibacter sp.]